MKDRAGIDTGDLAAYLKNRFYDADAALFAQSVFARLNLPLPQEGEFYDTRDRGALVPLTPYGCALRFTSEWHPHYVHTHVLQPLLSFSSGKLRADLSPGVDTPYAFPDVRVPDYTEWGRIYDAMDESLQEYGVNVNDINGNNGGRLPAPYQNHFVFIDPGALQQLYGATQAVKKILPAALPPDDPQEQLFGRLKAAFRRAAESGSAADMAQAWARARAMKEAGILIANWEYNDYRGTTGIARRYDLRLRQNTPG